jgi:hypothetical protein
VIFINGDENYEDFKQCLLRVPPNIWFKIADVEGVNLDDIFYTTSIPPHILVKIMINLEYMIYVKNKLKINAVKWQGFFASISLDERFHFATFCPRGEGICYYLCRGTLQYINPAKQQADTKKGPFLMLI